MMLRRALHYFSVSNFTYLMLKPFVDDAGAKYGMFSVHHWLISIAVFVLGVLSIYAIMWIEEK